VSCGPCSRRHAQTVVWKRREPENMKAEDKYELIVDRVTKKLNTMSEVRLMEKVNQSCLTSGFGREVLRLSAFDTKFLKDCGVKVE
jgi:hypothetical protein